MDRSYTSSPLAPASTEFEPASNVRSMSNRNRSMAEHMTPLTFGWVTWLCCGASHVGDNNMANCCLSA
eukprot:11837-Eustigmatos_ZCMA.PRE.1